MVHGGDTAAAFRVDLDDGRRVFAKTHPAPPPGFFTTEASSLTWLRAAEAVSVPEVLAVSDDDPAHLVLEWIEEGQPAATTEAELGAALAALHDSGAPCFGRQDRRTTGSRALPNEPAATWAEFYARDRLLPLARLARDGGGSWIRRRSAGSRRWPGGSSASTVPTSRRRASTATSGPATAWSTRRGGAGWSTPPPMVATGSSTSP